MSRAPGPAWAPALGVNGALAPGTQARVALALVLALLPLLLIWPGPLVFTTEVLTHAEREGASHIWGLWAALETGHPLVVQDQLLSFPDGHQLVLVDPGQAPLYWLFGWISPAAGYNGLIWLNLLIAGGAGAGLALRTAPNRPAAHPALGAALAMCCPPLLASASEGTTEDFAVAWVLLQLVLLLRLVDAPSLKRAAALSAALAMAFYCGPYNGVWSLMVDCAVGAGLLYRRQWGQAKWALGAGLGAGVLVLPQLWALSQRAPGLPGTSARAGLPPVFESPFFRGGLHHGADLTDPYLPLLLTGGQGQVSHTAYIGAAALLLSGWALWRDKSLWPWVLGAALMSSLAWGPMLYFKGELLSVGGRIALGPAGLLSLALPPLARLSRWYRAGAVAFFLLLPPLLSLSRGARWRAPVIGGLVLLDLLLLAPLRWPLHHTPLPQALPAGGPLLELPAFATDNPPVGTWRDHNALAQTLHGRAIAGSFMVAPGPQASQAIGITMDLARTGSLSAQQASVLESAGWSALVVYPELLPGRGLWREQLACLGEPVLETEQAVLWGLEGLRGCVE